MADKICKDCGHIGKAKKKTCGTFGNEVSLWVLGILFLLIFSPLGMIIMAVAVLYSLWRMFAPCDKVCPQCSHKDTMIPLDSPVGEQMAKQFSKKEEEKQEEEKPETEQRRTMSSLNFMDRR